MIFVVWLIYGRFLNNNSANTANPIMIAAIIPATAGTKYVSAVDCVGAWVGSGVGAVSLAQLDLVQEILKFAF
jgi:hypothetical protein